MERWSLHPPHACPPPYHEGVGGGKGTISPLSKLRIKSEHEQVNRVARQWLEGHEPPLIGMGEWEKNRRLDPHDLHDDHVHRITSPHHFTEHAHVRQGPTPQGMCLEVKGQEASAVKTRYGLKTPRQIIFSLGFEGWPTDGFTTS